MQCVEHAEGGQSVNVDTSKEKVHMALVLNEILGVARPHRVWVENYQTLLTHSLVFYDSKNNTSLLHRKFCKI